MNILNIPGSDKIARHFRRALLDGARGEKPFLHWELEDVLPEELCLHIIGLPLAPLIIDDCKGVRDVNNALRTFFTPRLQSQYPVLARFAEAMQRPDVAQICGRTCGFEVEGAYLRMEYIQDIDGCWLKPHCDVPQKLCSMVIYLCTGPEAADWGTDIYDEQQRWIGRTPTQFNSAVIFIPGKNTWHGFEKRRIAGIRRLIEINYVHPSWRDKDQLCFPDRPVRLTSKETGAGACAPTPASN